MSSAIGSINNVKIFILYLMKNINYPLDYVTVNDIVMQTDYVMFLDFAEGFNQLLDADLIKKVEEDGEEKYTVTDKGAIVAGELKSDIISSILDKDSEMGEEKQTAFFSFSTEVDSHILSPSLQSVIGRLSIIHPSVSIIHPLLPLRLKTGNEE